MKIIQYTVSHTVFILNAQMIKQIDTIQSMILLIIKMTFFEFLNFLTFWHFTYEGMFPFAQDYNFFVVCGVARWRIFHFLRL